MIKLRNLKKVLYSRYKVFEMFADYVLKINKKKLFKNNTVII